VSRIEVDLFGLILIKVVREMVKRKSEVALADADQHKAIREKYLKTDKVSPRFVVVVTRFR